MAKILVSKSGPLSGEVHISGSKNAALPILAACILADEKCVLKNIPHLSDIENMCEILKLFGANLSSCGKNQLCVDTSTLYQTVIPNELSAKLRASFLIMGPLVSKFGHAKMCFPGGCKIGSRPIDLHLKGLSAMGADITQGHGYIEARAKSLQGARIYLDFPSVGATQNLIMAACMANGVTNILNAATEPEVLDLCTFLKNMGAKISGAGTSCLKITGVKKLSGCSHFIIPDRIEAGTFMVAAAATGGNIKIKNAIKEHLKPVTAKLCEMGAEISEEIDCINVTSKGNLKSSDIKTLPFPGFPTDMQSMFLPLMSISNGTSIITETIFENRFMNVPELLKMNSNIKTEGRTAIIEGVKNLSGASVKATDLRSGASLVIAGLIANGQTKIDEAEHIYRGYENFEQKLISLGANIQKI